MDFNIWKNNIEGCIQEIADVQFQREAWLHEQPGLSVSFVELICQLYDDFNFRMFLDELENRGEFDLLSALNGFNSRLRSFLDDNPDIVDNEEVLKHPEWHRISREAKRILPFFHELERRNE